MALLVAEIALNMVSGGELIRVGSQEVVPYFKCAWEMFSIASALGSFEKYIPDDYDKDYRSRGEKRLSG